MQIQKNVRLVFRTLFRTDYSFLTKVKILFFLEKLELKLIFNIPGRQKIVHEKFLAFDISSFNYETLQYLIIEIFIDRNYRFKSNNPKPFIIDCGANMGIATIYFKWLYPKSRIFCFEPDPQVYQLLKKNVENNQLSDVTLFNLALSDKKGSINFYPFGEKSEWNFGIGSTKFESKTDTQKISVDCVVLSDYIKNEIVDYIKMDIEGAESDVIKELVKTGTLKNVKQFAIEFHDPIKKSALGSFLSLFELENFQYKVDLGKFGRDLQFYLIQCYKENNPD